MYLCQGGNDVLPYFYVLMYFHVLPVLRSYSEYRSRSNFRTPSTTGVQGVHGSTGVRRFSIDLCPRDNDTVPSVCIDINIKTGEDSSTLNIKSALLICQREKRWIKIDAFVFQVYDSLR
jgi:hypothetical protein